MSKQVIVDYIPFEVSPQQINESMSKNGGRLVVKEQARVVSEREDKLLAETMEQVTESKALSDSESEEDDTMGVAEVV